MKRGWTPTRGEKLETFTEEGNVHDRWAVAVTQVNSAVIVGHLPKEILAISYVTYFFIKHKGEITGEVTGKRHCSRHAEGGVEIPAKVTFYHVNN